MTVAPGRLMFLACGLVLAGCAAPSKPPAGGAAPATAPTTQRVAAATAAPRDTGKLTVSDPCPTKLHDVCGPLLMYLTTNYRMPERLDELKQMPGGEGIADFSCPTSKLAYVYNPAGVVGANVSQRAVLYDAAPSHAGYRWAVIVREATPNAPFIAEVVAWPESRFPRTLPGN